MFHQPITLLNNNILDRDLDEIDDDDDDDDYYNDDDLYDGGLFAVDNDSEISVD